MPKRPSLQFYPGDWRSNTKLRGASLIDRGVWIDVICLLHDSDEYGLLRWSLDKIASAVPCHVNQVRSIVDQGILKGAPAGERSEPVEIFVASTGETHLVLPPLDGPVWFSSRMLEDEYRRRLSRDIGRRGGNPQLGGSLGGEPLSDSSGSPKGVNQTLNQRVNPPVNPPLKRKRKRKNSSGEGVEGGDWCPLSEAPGMPVVPKELRTSEFLAAWENWFGYRVERGPRMTPKAAEMALKKCIAMGAKRAVEAIENSIGGSYQGIFEDRNGSKPGRSHHPPPRPPTTTATVIDYGPARRKP